MDAHDPYAPPPPFDKRFEGKEDDSKMSELLQIINARPREHGRIPMSSQETAYILSQYDGGIAYVDAQIERLVDKLRDLTLIERIR